MQVRPLHDRLIVQRLDAPDPLPGAIVIPDSAKEKPQHGKVLAAGLGKSHDGGPRAPLDVKAGDTVLFGKYSGQEVKLDGVDYLILKEDEVLAIEDAGPVAAGQPAETPAEKRVQTSASGSRTH
ncbi:MAG: co-chaperone GroES [Vicinamibacterales bacterium]